MKNEYTLLNIDTYLSQLLDFEKFKFIDTINGIQVSRTPTPIHKIACAVDSSLEIIQSAVIHQADILLVHHGFYWGQVEPIIDSMYKKTQALLTSDMALYAIHLPLDAHLKYGNNIQIANRLGLSETSPFGDYKGFSIGVRGSFTNPQSFQKVHDALFQNDSYGETDIPIVTNNTPPHHHAISQYIHQDLPIKNVAIISGGGTKEIEFAHQSGIDLYITGDATHTAWLRAKELGISVIFAGHYFTEVWGVLALGAHLQKKFEIDSIFIDEPTGL